METSVNMTAVLMAAIVQFVIGAIWYMPLFGKLWGKIHGFDQYDRETQAIMQKQMMPLLLLQFVLGFVTAYVLAHFLVSIDVDFYRVAFWTWLGFSMPAQIAAVIFGGTSPQWIIAKSAVMAGGSLASTMAAAWILHVLG